MIDRLFQVLDAEFEEFPVLVAAAAAPAEVDAIAAYAGFALPPSYRRFVERYGAAIVGALPVYGVGAAEAMAKSSASVVAVTEQFRSEKWPGTLSSLVISMDQAGNAITMGECGRIGSFDHDSGQDIEIARDFEGFIERLIQENQ
jgi:SMI1-KNR4 cell-wall